MAGEQMIDILAAAGSRAWQDRRAVAETADIVAVLARRREVRRGYRARRRLWTWSVRCTWVDSPAVRAAVAKAGADYEALRTQAARLLIASP